jgi:hypothetical protein
MTVPHGELLLIHHSLRGTGKQPGDSTTYKHFKLKYSKHLSPDTFLTNISFSVVRPL